MNFDPLLLALSVSAVGILGVIAGVTALSRVVGELAQVNRFDEALRVDLLEHASTPEFRIRNWIKENGFVADSHLGDQLIAVHTGWRHHRPVALGELHNRSSRRERSRFPARLAGGIAATLLICGIGGTLLSVGPILQKFKVEINSDGTAQEASRDAENVNKMVQGLGSAFYPSLAALLWTVAVVITRGLYVQKTMRLARALDSLAFDYFLPEFSPRTLTDDFTELSAKLSAVADTMSERDAAFAETAESLANSIEQIKLLGPVVQKAGEDASQASSKLAKDTNNVVSAFAKHLAEDSPLFTAVEQLKESVGTTDLSVNQLTEVAQELTVTNRETAEIIAKLAIALKEAIDGVPEVIRVASENGAKEIGTASVALSSRAKETTDALIERLAKLLDATTKKIETTKTDIAQIAPAIAADLDKRINASVGGLIPAVSRFSGNRPNPPIFPRGPTEAITLTEIPVRAASGTPTVGSHPKGNDRGQDTPKRSWKRFLPFGDGRDGWL
jgi:hypothetical protein